MFLESNEHILIKNNQDELLFKLNKSLESIEIKISIIK